jgi:hypothetical protein
MMESTRYIVGRILSGSHFGNKISSLKVKEAERERERQEKEMQKRSMKAPMTYRAYSIFENRNYIGGISTIFTSHDGEVCDDGFRIESQLF